MPTSRSKRQLAESVRINKFGIFGIDSAIFSAYASTEKTLQYCGRLRLFAIPLPYSAAPTMSSALDPPVNITVDFWNRFEISCCTTGRTFWGGSPALTAFFTSHTIEGFASYRGEHCTSKLLEPCRCSLHNRKRAVIPVKFRYMDCDSRKGLCR